MHIFQSRENIKTCIFTAVKIQDLIFSQERNCKIGTTFFLFSQYGLREATLYAILVITIIIFHSWLREVNNNYISFMASPLMKYKYCPLHS